MLEIAARTNRLKILIVYASFGEGHRQAALALRQSFAGLGADEVVLLDLLAEAHPLLNRFSRFFYRHSYRLWPGLYGWLYDATRGMKSNSLFSRWLHSFGAEALRRLLEREKPDAVVHTFPMLVLPYAVRRASRAIPMYNVVTDFDLHMRWVHPQVAKYYVATEDLRERMARSGVPSALIAATGIPVRASFSAPRDAARVAERYGLEPGRPIALVMGGGCGGPNAVRSLCRRLAQAADLQVALVCGRDRALEAAMRAAFAPDRAPGGVRVFGYVETIHELMSVSSCIVTKPGGLTLSEAILANLPIFLYRPRPGQERDNARYLAAKGAAAVCRSPGELAAAIAGTLGDPVRLGAMRQAAGGLRQERASDRIALDIVRDLPAR